METDERIIKEFLNERKQQISDGGFTRRVMEHLPQVEYVPLVRRKWFMVLTAILSGVILLALYLSYAHSQLEGINLDCIPIIALEYMVIVIKTAFRLICETNLLVFVCLISAAYFFIGKALYMRLKY